MSNHHENFMQNKSSVLIVDDSLTNLAVFSEYLSELNCEVLVAINGIDALAQLENRQPDIILLDVIMPGIDGFETCRRLKKNPETRDIPVIFMTTLSETVDKVKGLNLGAVDYVTKPFQEEEVAARIKTHITVSHLQKELRAQNSWLQQEIQERRAAEEKLQKRNEELHFSEVRFRDLATTLSDWIWECDGHFVITYSSGRVKDILGYEIEEVLGKRPFDFMHTPDAEQFEADLKDLLLSKHPITDMEHWVQRKDGESICLLTNGLPILDEKGVLLGYRGAGKDITERKQMEAVTQEYNNILELEVSDRTRALEENNAHLEQEAHDRRQVEEELRASEERFSLAVHGANYGLWDWNLENNNIYRSPRWKQMLGYDENELPDTLDVWEALIHPDDLEQAKATVDNYLERKVPVYENIFRMKHKTGNYLWVLERGVAVWDEQKKPIRFVGTMMDLTEQKQAEKNLRESEERFALALRGANDGLWDWDLENNSIYFSPCWKQIIGYTDNEFASKVEEWQKQVHPDDLAGMLEVMDAYLNKKVPVYANSYRIRHKDGHYVWVMDRGAALWGGDGKTYRFVGTHMDISVQKKLEADLKQALDRFERFSNASGEAFWDWDVRNETIYFSPRWNLLLGYEEHAERGNSLEEFKARLHPEESRQLLAQLNAYVNDGQNAFENIHRLQHHDGHYLVVLSRAYAVRDEEGRSLSVTVAHTDLSEQMRLQQELQQNKDYYQGIIEEAGIALALLHIDGHFREVNTAFASTLGYQAEELEELNFFKDFTEDDFKVREQIEIQDMKIRGKIKPYQKRCMDKAGNPISVKVSGVLVRRDEDPLIWIHLEKLDGDRDSA